MPDKIKEIQNKNEEILKFSDESYNQTFSSGAANISSFLHANTSYSNHSYQKISNIENQYHDFENFLNLVSFLIILKLF